MCVKVSSSRGRPGLQLNTQSVPHLWVNWSKRKQTSGTCRPLCKLCNNNLLSLRSNGKYFIYFGIQWSVVLLNWNYCKNYIYMI